MPTRKTTIGRRKGSKGGSKGGRRKTLKKSSKKSNWVKFLTNYHREQKKTKKNWTFKDSMKSAKKIWKKEKKRFSMRGGGDVPVEETLTQSTQSTPPTQPTQPTPEQDQYVPDEETSTPLTPDEDGPDEETPTQSTLDEDGPPTLEDE